jgi:hypothetical protein
MSPERATSIATAAGSAKIIAGANRLFVEAKSGRCCGCQEAAPLAIGNFKNTLQELVMRVITRRLLKAE